MEGEVCWTPTATVSSSEPAFGLQVRSSTAAVGAFALTDSIPFSMAAVDEYIWLHPTVSPFAALRTK